MGRLWHRYVLKHAQTVRSMTNLAGDSGSNKQTNCQCGDRWIGG